MEPLTKDQLKRISNAYHELVEIHPELRVEQFFSESASIKPMSKKFEGQLRTIVNESLPQESDVGVTRMVQELVALSQGRPAILISEDDFDLTAHETLPDVLKNLLTENRNLIKTAIRGVGRIEVANHPNRSWVGTGFILAAPDGRDIVVTNRHVAIEFAYRRNDGNYQFVDGLLSGSQVTSTLDIKEEASSIAGDTSMSIPIVEVLHIEDSPGPDLAFLRLAVSSDRPDVSRLELASEVEERTPSAVIGYPAKDTRETDLNVVLDLLGDVYNKKRLAPGVLKSISGTSVSHDCSTLGGNSGSPLVDLRSGNVLGLHYGGTFPNPINYAVSATTLAEKLDQLATRTRPARPTDESATNEGHAMNNKTNQNGGRKVTVEVPLRITVELGEASTGEANQNPLPIDAAVHDASSAYSSMPGIVNVRGGRLLTNGKFSDERAIVLSLDYTADGSEETIAKIPETYGGYAVQVRPATAEEILRAYGYTAFESVPRIRYEEPEDLSLDLVEEDMAAVFHVSPDAGWPTLQEFLSETQKSLTIGLYNFATDHVRNAVEQAVGTAPRTLDLVLGDASIDREHTDSFERELVRHFSDMMGERFRYELADGRRRLFAGHYHTKVAVRDSSAFWLSSGNWEPSNQPEVDPIADNETGFSLLRNKNREWHAVIENVALAKMLEDYIKYDLESYRELRRSIREATPAELPPMVLVPISASIEERTPRQATYFAPLRVEKRLRIQPLMTPDNFIEHVQSLVESATQSVELQNQTVKWRDRNVDPRFERLMKTLLEKHRDGVDVRFILRSDYSPEMKEMLIDQGFEADQIRLLSRCHTKGLIVDSERVLLGSHNLSEYGAIANRDASLIVDDVEVASYFRKIFQFDWDRASRRVRETPIGMSIHRVGEPVPEGYELVPLAEFGL
ncbi:phospholipase D-like domain-containing protein [Aliiroseovarius sp. 2305UL8-7]|uniref:phospholipase D-like domain-containing protein n=1 Tax=Aliiroseovarius conchicola TaxID=3121637 RepID=UPI0035272636